MLHRFDARMYLHSTYTYTVHANVSHKLRIARVAASPKRQLSVTKFWCPSRNTVPNYVVTYKKCSHPPFSPISWQIHRSGIARFIQPSPWNFCPGLGRETRTKANKEERKKRLEGWYALSLSQATTASTKQ